MAFSRLVESFQTNEVSHIFHFSVSFFFLFFFPRKIQKARTMDLFTNAAAILNKLDLRSVMGCPGGMSTFCLVFMGTLQGILS